MCIAEPTLARDAALLLYAIFAWFFVVLQVAYLQTTAKSYVQRCCRTDALLNHGSILCLHTMNNDNVWV